MTRIVCAIAILFLPTILHAEPIRFARSPALSPDGKTIAFSYLGDLWTVDASGGVARHLTMHEKHDFNPVFSPDGQWIAFSSNRHGQYDVFVIPVKGGRPKRLTFDSADDHVTGWSPDSGSILFMSSREIDLPYKVELYSISLAGGQPKRISVFEGRDGSYSPKGDQIAYVRGPGTWYRKGYHGSSNDDIWICDADGSNNRRLTTHNGQDNYPNWSPTARRSTTSAIAAAAGESRQPGNRRQPVRLTEHKDEFVRRARISANGERSSTNAASISDLLDQVEEVASSHRGERRRQGRQRDDQDLHDRRQRILVVAR